jgi:hypothetical protein
MDSAMIGKVEKAKRYAQERSRFHFKQFSVAVDGENSSHTVSFDQGAWNCDCEFFHLRQACSHTMALERVLEDMIVKLEE